MKRITLVKTQYTAMHHNTIIGLLMKRCQTCERESEYALFKLSHAVRFTSLINDHTDCRVYTFK